MKIKEFNEMQKKAMAKGIAKEHYEWDNKRLFSYILGELPLEREVNRYLGKELTKDQIKQNEIINNINEIIKKYNYNMKIEKDELDKLEKYYSDLEQYIEKYYTSYSDIMNALKFNKVFLISGPGGIGKSQFLYEFSEEINGKFEYLCMYGKYCENIESNIYTQIKKIIQDNRFYLIIDAINELDKELRESLITFINENKDNQNMRVIISYRDFSMNSIDEEKVKLIIDEDEIFTGVDPDFALEKIAEKYNLDLSIYDKLLYDNNPLHLKLIIKTISENQLTNKKLKSITKGTYIYEQFIKQVLTKSDWNMTKDIVEYMFKHKAKALKVSELNSIEQTNFEKYINKMKMNNFIGTYEHDNDIYMYFINETLTDYLIARFLMNKINNLEIQEIENNINEMVKVFYSIQDKIILMLFEKYENNIETAIKIIKETDLKSHLNIDIFNEIILNDININKIQKSFKPNIHIKKLLITAGGNENNPFNCKNFINSKLKQIYINEQLDLDRYDATKIKNKLKRYVQTISKFSYDDNYIEEKFWYGIWCSASVNNVIRALSKKLVYEITNTYSGYINKLISTYYEISDEYIQEMIIQVLGSMKKNNKYIIKFFNRINNEKQCNIKNIDFISNYLYGEENYEKFKKINLLKDTDKRKDNNISNFLDRVFFTFKYDYDFFGFDSYSSTITFQTKFIEDNKKKVIKVNHFINKNFKCLDDDSCHSAYFKECFIDGKYNINEKLIDDKKIYLAWQKVFKKYLKKYGIKIKELEDVHVYEEIEKGIVYKALDLSLSYINGSITCNYYTNEFEVYGDYKGYQFNWYDKYREKAEIYYPIPVFNPSIENLDNKILKKVFLPKRKNIKWVKDSEMGLENINRLIQPIRYENEDYYMIYGNIRLDEKSNDEYGNSWIDTYVINLAIDENYNLSNISNDDREYTIETEKYKGNINDYENTKYTLSTSLYSSSELKDLYVTTDFNLPPTIIIKEFNLHYDKFSSSWINSSNENVVLVNNNEGRWYGQGCSGTLYLKKKYYDKLKKKHNYKYFCFTEKYHPKTGYCNDSALQVQINSDGTIIKYKHYKSHKSHSQNVSKCKTCIVYNKENEDRKKWKDNKFENFLIDDIWDDYKASDKIDKTKV